ncbi:MAG: HupU protein [Chloroflexi bacterium]|nr:HupU protein [Chloroflexota bacterium]
MINLLWLQGGCCSGDTISFLNAEEPDVLTAFRMLDVRLLWHPSLSMETGEDVIKILEDIIHGRKSLDVLVVEGAVPLGPDKSGRYAVFHGRPFKDWVSDLSKVCRYMVALGTCASFGGISSAAPRPTDTTGLQFCGTQKGGLLGPDYISGAKLPVISLPGCPAHPDWLTHTLTALASGSFERKGLDAYNRPRIFYGGLAHQGCPRNEYYEFKASAEEFSQQGCMFENLGCKGTICSSDCNERLWLGRTGSCTRGGFPCIACTSPDFPDGQRPYFETLKIADIPVTLPRDVPKAWYIGISGLAKAATPERLKKNATSFKKIESEKEQ